MCVYVFVRVYVTNAIGCTETYSQPLSVVFGMSTFLFNGVSCVNINNDDWILIETTTWRKTYERGPIRSHKNGLIFFFFVCEMDFALNDLYVCLCFGLVN